MMCLGTPPKKRHAASRPAHTSSTVCVNVGHTCMYRLDDSVTINAHTRRAFPSASTTIPPSPPSPRRPLPPPPCPAPCLLASARLRLACLRALVKFCRFFLRVFFF